MKTLLSVLMLTGLVLPSASFAATTQLSGLNGSTAATMMNALVIQSENDPTIVIDRSVYTVLRVSKTDAYSSVVCSRYEFGGTPAQFECSVSSN